MHILDMDVNCTIMSKKQHLVLHYKELTHFDMILNNSFI